MGNEATIVKGIKNVEVADALVDYMVARNIKRVAYKEYNEAVQDLLPSEEAKRDAWRAAMARANKMQERVERLANKAVQDSLYTDANYYDAVMDEVAVWKVTRP